MTSQHTRRRKLHARNCRRRHRRSAIELLEGRFLLAVDLNFDGQGFSGVRPPDTVGDVGLAHYVQATNDNAGTNITIYNKSDGSVAVSQFNLSTLAAGATGSSPYTGRGDPIVLYDHIADRWVLMEFELTGNELDIFISDTSTPTGNGADWTQYRINAQNFPDYPKITLWPDAYLIGTNETDNPVYVLDRNAMLAGSGGLITAIRRSTTDRPNWPFNHTMPVQFDGAMLPPSGSPGLFIRQVDDELTNPGGANAGADFIELWAFDPDFTTPANSTYALAQSIAVADFALIDVSFDDVPQPGTAQRLDALDDVFLWRPQYRNFGAYETLVGCFVVDDAATAVDQAGMRWFELRRSGGGAWTVHQQGTYAPDATHRFAGAIAMDGDGNIAMAYNVSSTSVFPGIRYVGRLATDPLGTMPQAEITLVDGLSSQTNSNRWGDYSAMSIDPVDDSTFWFTGEYMTGGGLWATRIASLTLETGPAGTGEIHGSLWEDLNGNGIWEQPDEPALPDWTVYLDLNQNGRLDLEAPEEPDGSDQVEEIELNDSIAAAQDVDGAGWTLAANPDIYESTTRPHISILGTGDGTFDYYSFTVSQANVTVTFDMDYTSFDTELFLYNAAGTLLDDNDDIPPVFDPEIGEFVFIDPGSSTTLDSFLSYLFTTPGQYVIGVGRYNSFGSPGGITGNKPLGGDSYTLHISLQGHQPVTAEPFTITAADGSYEFTGLAPGTYLVAEQLEPGWVQTYPHPPLGVAVFDDPSFVDTSGGGSGEATNVQASLAELGYSVQTFQGTSLADFVAGLEGADLMVLPEQEFGNLAAAMDAGAIATLQQYVQEGGGLIIHGYSELADDFLNTVFEWGIDDEFVNVASEITLGEDAFGTQFVGGPTSLPTNNGTAALFTASLPAGSRVIYGSAGDIAVVALLPYGLGEVVYLGWDWFDAEPIGAQDGGWLSVLDAAVREAPVTGTHAVVVAGTPVVDIDFGNRHATPEPGDFDGDSELTANDIDLLCELIHENDPAADLNNDDSVNLLDLDYMIGVIFDTEYGDADLDHDVDAADFDAWRTRDSLGDPIGWATGDWDCDGDVDGTDLDIWRTRPASIAGGADLAHTASLNPDSPPASEAVSDAATIASTDAEGTTSSARSGPAHARVEHAPRATPVLASTRIASTAPVDEPSIPARIRHWRRGAAPDLATLDALLATWSAS